MLLQAEQIIEQYPLTYVVKNVLPHPGFVCLYGPSGVGKSFLALDIASKISDNGEWFGHRVTHSNVVYMGLEGQEGLAQRIKAYGKYHGGDDGKCVIFRIEPFSLLNTRNVDSLIKELHAAFGEYNISTIIIDTLNAASPGGEENSSSDMGKILESVKRIMDECVVCVILVHHSGKDAARGLRGHSSLFAASDVVIEVTREGDLRNWRIVKSKEGADGESYPFRLVSVDLGVDSDGDTQTSCVVVPEVPAADYMTRVKLPSGGNQRIVFRVANELFQQTKRYGEAQAPANCPCIRVDDLIEGCRGRLSTEPRRVPERAREAITSLVNKGCLVLRDGWLWLP